MANYVTNLILGGVNMLLSIDITDLTFSNVIEAIAVLIVIWFVIKNFAEIKDRAAKVFARRQSWDKAAKIIEEKEEIWDKGLADLENRRLDTMERYDKRFDSIEQTIKTNHTDTENRIKEVKSDVLLLTECMRAVLDGLHQLNCNGKVTEASEKLDSYLVSRMGR